MAVLTDDEMGTRLAGSMAAYSDPYSADMTADMTDIHSDDMKAVRTAVQTDIHSAAPMVHGMAVRMAAYSDML